MGVCANVSAVAYPTTLTAAPSYFFPLTDANANSWPLPEYHFFNYSPAGAWVPDARFGSVFQCSVCLWAHQFHPLSACCVVAWQMPQGLGSRI